MRVLLFSAALVVTPGVTFAQDVAQPAAAAAQVDTSVRQRLDRRATEVAAVLKGTRRAEQTFAPGFLAQVPAAQLIALHDQLAAAYGPLGDATITPTSRFEGEISLRYAKALVRGPLVLSPEAPHQVIGLRIASTDPIDDSKASVEKDLAALPGRVNAYFAPLGGGSPVVTVGADRPLALGSTFKLYVLSALQRAVASGKLSWGQTVPLTARSYPSGLTQDWAPGTPVTVQTLATLMMQISDNTATDQLIALLGREAVEAEFRATNRDSAPTLPFLTTREMFAIKTDPPLRTRYAASAETERRRILAALPAAGPPPAQVGQAFAGAPMAIDRIEWFASPQSLASLLQRLSGPEAETARSVLTASKGMSVEIAARWDYVGFKGGSEPGVLNYTWLLRDKAGAWHIATLGWNNPAGPVDSAKLNALAMRMLALAQ